MPREVRFANRFTRGIKPLLQSQTNPLLKFVRISASSESGAPGHPQRVGPAVLAEAGSARHQMLDDPRGAGVRLAGVVVVEGENAARSNLGRVIDEIEFGAFAGLLPVDQEQIDL